MLDYNGNIKQGKQESVDERIQIMEVSSERSHDELTYDITHFINKVSAICDIVSATSTARKGKTTAEQLAKRLNIPYEMAKKTLKYTMQIATRSSDEPTLTRKYRTNDRMLRYHRLSCDSFMDKNVASKDSVSLRGFKSCQVFATEFSHVFVVPMEEKSGKMLHWR